MSRKPLSANPDQSELEPHVRSALIAWGRGNMTPGQQVSVLKWIVEDLTLALTPMPPQEAHKSGYTTGQQRVGMVILKLTGAGLNPPKSDEREDG